MIKQLSEQTAEDLCAQQVITSLPDCIKELIDNSIDAKSSFIKVVLHEYGKTKIEVIDNGMGIDSFDFLGKKGSTSKNKLNQKFDYLGFRGEAVHSIGKVSGAMKIQSKCSKDGYRRKFDVTTLNLEQFKEERICSGEFNFHLPNREGSKNTGTKVTIEKIFERLPVRYIELQSKFKQFLKKTHEMIKEFCLIYPEIQFLFVNVREGKQEALIETASHKRFDRMAWLDRIKELDQKIGNNLTYISHGLFEGYVLSKIESGSSKQNSYIKKNYHYLFANRRPIDILPSILAVLNDIYKKYNNSTKYAFVLNLKLDYQQIDVNLSPNKREIFIRKQALEEICENLKKEITEKVIEEIPSLSRYEEKQEKKGKNAGTASQMESFIAANNTVVSQTNDVMPSSQPVQAVGLPQPRIDGRNPRKSIYFPLKQPQQNIQNNNPSVNPFGKSTASLASQNAPSEAKDTKTAKSSSFEDIQLPKIVVDRNKLKEQLNSKLGISFSGLKRAPETATKPSETVSKASLEAIEDDGRPVNQKQLEQIKKRNQQAKLRQQEEDAKKRAAFLEEIKQVKLEESALQQQQQHQQQHQQQQQQQHQQQQQPPLPVIGQMRYPDEGQVPKTTRDGFGRQTLMEQEVRMRQNEEEDEGEPSEGLKEEEGVELGSKNHDSELAIRIKSKLNVDMSQIFEKFNSKKTGIANHLQSSDQKLAPQQMVPEVRQQSNGKEQSKDEQQVFEQLGELAPEGLKKQEFQQFNILGQFNLGFIISHHGDTFYMVDQHAADEKYQFEKNLAKSKHPECINCFQEKEITPIQFDEIQEAKYLLQEAGFYYKIVNTTLKLERCPVFYQKKLGMDFFDEIVSQKRELQKLNKFSSMCASMACRSAIKVGDTLSKEEMRKEVHNLSSLNAPWNCPHGRPTLIKLGKISSFTESVQKKKEYIL